MVKFGVTCHFFHVGEIYSIYKDTGGGGSEATGAFVFLNTYGGFSWWRIWATYPFFSILYQNWAYDPDICAISRGICPVYRP